MIESSLLQPLRHHGVQLQQGGAVLLGRVRLPARRRRRHAAGSRPLVLRDPPSAATGRRASRAARSAGSGCRAARCSRSSSSSRSCRRTSIPWNRVGLTHISFNVRNTHRWYDYLQQQRRGVREQAGALAARPHVLLRARLRRQSDRDDGSRLHALRAAVARAAWRLDLQARDVSEVLRMTAGPLARRESTCSNRGDPPHVRRPGPRSRTDLRAADPA